MMTLVYIYSIKLRDASITDYISQYVTTERNLDDSSSLHLSLWGSSTRHAINGKRIVFPILNYLGVFVTV